MFVCSLASDIDWAISLTKGEVFKEESEYIRRNVIFCSVCHLLASNLLNGEKKGEKKEKREREGE